MADLISEIAAKAGIDAGMAQKGVGALLSTLQKHVPPDAYAKVASAVPNAGSILSSFQSAPSATQGLGGGLAGLAGMAGGLLGGKSEAATMLVSQFSKAGFSLDAVKSFLPVAFGLIKDKLPPDTLKQIEGAIPGLSSLAGGEGGGIMDKIKKLF